MYNFKDGLNICSEYIIYRLLSACSKEKSSFKYISNIFQTGEGKKARKCEKKQIFFLFMYDAMIPPQKKNSLL